MAILRTSSRISRLMAGRPRGGRLFFDNRAQNRRKRSRCQRTTVSGWTITRAVRQSFQPRVSKTQNHRSRCVSWGRLWNLIEARRGPIDIERLVEIAVPLDIGSPTERAA